MKPKKPSGRPRLPRPDTLPGRIGARLEASRESRGLTQTQLVAASGVSLGTLARYERGEVDPQAGVLAALAAALGMTGRELLRPVKGW